MSFREILERSRYIRIAPGSGNIKPDCHYVRALFDAYGIFNIEDEKIRNMAARFERTVIRALLDCCEARVDPRPLLATRRRRR